MWIKLKGKLISKNTEIGGKKTKDMINEIIKIDPKIKFAALKEFVLSCQRIHTIAFFQWRNLYPSKLKCD
jgi:hypothetical protein